MQPSSNHPIGRWRANLVANLAGDVLEIGIGAGENLPHYRKARHVWGLEPDAKRAAAARRRAQSIATPVTIDEAFAERLPYASASFDHVVSSLVFCSVNDPLAVLGEIRRVLRPGGSLHMREHIRPQTPFFAQVAHWLTPLQRRLFWNCHLDRPTMDMLRAEGWTVELLSKRAVLVHLRATPPLVR